MQKDLQRLEKIFKFCQKYIDYQKYRKVFEIFENFWDLKNAKISLKT